MRVLHISKFDPTLGGIHDDVVAFEQIPHDRLMNAAVGVAGCQHGKASLIEKITNSIGQRHELQIPSGLVKLQLSK
jgi:hypothetical protein